MSPAEVTFSGDADCQIPAPGHRGSALRFDDAFQENIQLAGVHQAIFGAKERDHETRSTVSFLDELEIEVSLVIEHPRVDERSRFREEGITFDRHDHGLGMFFEPFSDELVDAVIELGRSEKGDAP